MFKKRIVLNCVLIAVSLILFMFAMINQVKELIYLSIFLFLFSFANAMLFLDLDKMQEEMKKMKNDYTTDIKKLNKEIEKIKEKIKYDDDD